MSEQPNFILQHPTSEYLNDEQKAKLELLQKNNDTFNLRDLHLVDKGDLEDEINQQLLAEEKIQELKNQISETKRATTEQRERRLEARKTKEEAITKIIKVVDGYKNYLSLLGVESNEIIERNIINLKNEVTDLAAADVATIQKNITKLAIQQQIGGLLSAEDFNYTSLLNLPEDKSPLPPVPANQDFVKIIEAKNSAPQKTNTDGTLKNNLSPLPATIQASAVEPKSETAENNQEFKNPEKIQEIPKVNGWNGYNSLTEMPTIFQQTIPVEYQLDAKNLTDEQLSGILNDFNPIAEEQDFNKQGSAFYVKVIKMQGKDYYFVKQTVLQDAKKLARKLQEIKTPQTPKANPVIPVALQNLENPQQPENLENPNLPKTSDTPGNIVTFEGGDSYRVSPGNNGNIRLDEVKPENPQQSEDLEKSDFETLQTEIDSITTDNFDLQVSEFDKAQQDTDKHPSIALEDFKLALAANVLQNNAYVITNVNQQSMGVVSLTQKQQPANPNLDDQTPASTENKKLTERTSEFGEEAVRIFNEKRFKKGGLLLKAVNFGKGALAFGGNVWNGVQKNALPVISSISSKLSSKTSDLRVSSWKKNVIKNYPVVFTKKHLEYLEEDLRDKKITENEYASELEKWEGDREKFLNTIDTINKTLSNKFFAEKQIAGGKDEWGYTLQNAADQQTYAETAKLCRLLTGNFGKKSDGTYPYSENILTIAEKALRSSVEVYSPDGKKIEKVSDFIDAYPAFEKTALGQAVLDMQKRKMNYNIQYYNMQSEEATAKKYGRTLSEEGREKVEAYSQKAIKNIQAFVENNLSLAEIPNEVSESLEALPQNERTDLKLFKLLLVNGEGISVCNVNGRPITTIQGLLETFPYLQHTNIADFAQLEASINSQQAPVQNPSQEAAIETQNPLPLNTKVKIAEREPAGIER